MASISALHTEGPGFAPHVEPWTIPQVRRAPDARHEHVGGGAPLSEIHFLWGDSNIHGTGVEVEGEEGRKGIFSVKIFHLAHFTPIFLKTFRLSLHNQNGSQVT